MPASIRDSVRPSFFISYSRRQKQIADEIKAMLLGGTRAIWFDLDEIASGDIWMSEIQSGIASCDEVVLLLSEDSLRSRVVETEIEIAQRNGKIIRPVLVASVTSRIPEPIAQVHFIDLSKPLSQDERRARLSALFIESADQGPLAQVLKTVACRSIWPTFHRDHLTPKGQLVIQGYASALQGLRERYSQSSPMWLNAGLSMCVVGRWDEGIALLRAYAHAANTFAGWYFLASHLPRQALTLRISSETLREAVDAVEAALAFGENPLGILVRAILMAGTTSSGPRNLDKQIQRFVWAERAAPEVPSEYVRLFWCLQRSLGLLGDHEQPIRELLRGKADEYQSDARPQVDAEILRFQA